MTPGVSALYSERASPRYIEAREPRRSGPRAWTAYQRGARSHLAPLRHPGPRIAQVGSGRPAWPAFGTPAPGCRVAASGEWAP